MNAKNNQNKLTKTTSDKQQLFSTNLRYKVLFTNKANKKMNLQDRMNYYHVNGVSIAVIDHGKIAETFVYGLADAINKKPLTANTLLQAGSLSKTITAFGILYLVQQIILSLDEDVNLYLKSWHVAENEFTTIEKVTLRRILSHSAGLTVSGFPGYELGSQIPTTVQVLEGIKPPANTDEVKVDNVPGTKWRYSGGGTTIAQLVIEDVTKQSFSNWIAKNILHPLGMTNSSFNQPPPTQYILASGHDLNGNPINGKYHIYPEMAAAGLWSTPSDIAQFILYLQNNMSSTSNNPLISSNLIHEMFKKHMPVMGKIDHGLGVFLKKLDDDIFFFHDGQDRGFIAKYCGLLKEKSGFVIMMNSDANGWYLMEEISNSLTDIYQWKGFAPVYRKVADNDKRLYAQWIGNYLAKENQREIIITADGDKLFLKEHATMPQIELHAETNYRYFTQEGNHIIDFDKENLDTLILTDHNGEVMTFNKYNK